MKIIAISDIHGYLPEIKEAFDLLLIAGDICPVYCHSTAFQADWLLSDFLAWVAQLPFKDEHSKVVVIAGNHDFVLSRDWFNTDSWCEKSNGRLVYLCNEEYTFKCEGKDYRIYGTPYCKQFGSWAFMVPLNEIGNYYKDIPGGIDILISHDAPGFGGFGFIREGDYTGVDASNPVLAKHILRAKPKYAFHGHIHSSSHDLKEVEGIKACCVSIMNEAYEPKYEPLMLDI